MALFTDGPSIGIDELRRHDSGLLEVALVESIDLTAKLELAHAEVGVEIGGLLERARPSYDPILTPNSTSLRNLVVTVPIQLWEAYQTLTLTYRDAYFGQLNDRYKAKWQDFASRARWAKDMLIESGVALASDPIPRAGLPTVNQIAAAENGGTIYLSISFTNAAGEEGQASRAVTVTTLDGNVADAAAPSRLPANVTGWNLYGGTAPDAMYLQNESPLDLGSDFAFYPSAAATTGALPGGGQLPNLCRAIPRRLQRG